MTAAAGVGYFFSSLFVFTFAILLKPLAEEFGWSREAVSFAYAGMALAVAVSAPLVGHLVDRVGPRLVVGPFMLVSACAFTSLSALTPNLWHLYAIFIVIGLVGTANSPVVYVRVIASWFDRRRGVALAAVIACAAVGGIVHPIVAQALVPRLGWRITCLTIGCVMLAVGVPIVSRFVREAPRTSQAAEAGSGTATRDALRSRVFWTLITVVFGSTMAMNAVFVHLAALLTDRGVAAGRAVIAVSAMGAASLLGRVLTGWLIDRFDATRVSFVLLMIAGVGIFLLRGGPSLQTAIVAAALFGFGTGGEVDVTPYLLSRYFGLRSLSALYGLHWTAFGLSGAAGPILMGRAFDATGSYDGLLVAFAMALVGAATLMLTLPAYHSRPEPALAAL